MTTQAILDSIYIIPAILDHLEKPTVNTRRILEELGINYEQLKELKNIDSLLQYHVQSVETKFNPEYGLLRKGLSQYFNQHLSCIWKKLGIVNQTNKVLLDYCCGAGQYYKQFKVDNPESFTIEIDKSGDDMKIMKVDFEKTPNWYHNFIGHFDYVLLAEILHCKNYFWQQYLIDSSISMLKKKGRLIIVENKDYQMAYRISKIKNEQHEIIDDRKLASILANKNLGLKNKWVINKHTFYDYELI